MGEEEVTLRLPPVIGAYLRAKKPKGMPLSRWLVVYLMEKLRKEIVLRAELTAAEMAEYDLCPCESGKLVKDCCQRPS